MDASALKGLKLYLTPFTLDSVLLYHRLQREGVLAEAFMDDNALLWNKTYKDIPVIKRYNAASAGGCKFLVCSAVYFEQIREDLLSRGVPGDAILDGASLETRHRDYEIADDIDEAAYLRYVPVNAYFNENRGVARIKKLRLMKGRRDGIVLPVTDIVLTRRCSLRCRYCGAGMQYDREPKDYDPARVLKSFDVLMEKADFVEGVSLIGGEPLMYKNLTEVISYIGNSRYREKIGAFLLVTNGTILPDEACLKSLREQNVIVYLSNYGKNSGKLNEAVRALAVHGCLYYVFDIASWWLARQLIPDGQIPGGARQKRLECVNLCDKLQDGRLYYCGFLATGEANGIFPDDVSNHCDVLSESFSREQLRHYISSANLPKGCAWCTGSSEADLATKVPVAEQVGRPLEYSNLWGERRLAE